MRTMPHFADANMVKKIFIDKLWVGKIEKIGKNIDFLTKFAL